MRTLAIILASAVLSFAVNIVACYGNVCTEYHLTDARGYHRIQNGSKTYIRVVLRDGSLLDIGGDTFKIN